MAVILEQPQGIACEPVGLVAIKDDGRVIGNPIFEANSRTSPWGGNPASGMLKGGKPIHLDCTGNMADRIQQRIFIGFNNSDVRIEKVVCDPISFDKVFGVGGMT